MAEARAVSVTRSVEGGRVRGYVETEDKERIRNRLRRVEGQVRGVQRMVDEEAYCVDVLTQISGAVSALEKVGAILPKDHVEHCVRESVEDSGKVDEKIGELTAAVERFLRV
jgi:DNA-binding FrmR family transcriptional regulator